MSALLQESLLMVLGCVVREARALRADLKTLELPPSEARYFDETLTAIEERALALLAACGDSARVH